MEKNYSLRVTVLAIFQESAQCRRLLETVLVCCALVLFVLRVLAMLQIAWVVFETGYLVSF